jgi:hypothetical protein
MIYTINIIMKINRTITLYIITLFLLTACIPDPLDIDGIPVVKPQIVISTQIVPDESLVVLLTKTFGALDVIDENNPEKVLEQLAVTDAIVTITGPQGTSYTLQSLDNGVYGGLVIPFEVHKQYTLHVNSESLGEVTATTMVKPMISFEDIRANLYSNEFGDNLAQITHRINDPAGPNWYMLNVQEIERNDILRNVINPRDFTRLIDDTDFDGQRYTEVFKVVPRNYSKGDTILVSLSNISEEYYNFVKLRLDNRFSLVEFLGEPINYPSNVIGGKGFFNLYIPDFRTFVLE